MAYKYARGKVSRSDIYNQDDTEGNTFIDWSEDAFGIVAGGSIAFVISGSNTEISSSYNLSASAFYGDGSALENVTATATPAGSNMQIQYNNGGSAGAAANLYWNKDNNRLGIGTSAPSASLEIKHATSAVMQFSADNGRMYSVGSDGYGFIVHDETTSDVSGYRLVISDQADYLGYVGIGDGVSLAAQSHPKALLHLSSSDDQALFRVDTTGGQNNATTVLFATGSGRVGIGTPDPSSPLHVYGDVSSNYLTLIDNDASSAGHALKVTTDGNGSGTYVLDLEAQSTTLFRVRGDGRVGIGKVTSLPSACLTVSGTTEGDADIAIASKIQHIGDSDTYISFDDDEIVLAAGGRSFIKLEEASQDKLIINHGALDIDLKVGGENNANLIRTVASDDRVGIGTGSPNALLSVSGSEFDGLAIEVADNHTTYFQISGSEQGSVTSFGMTAAKAVNDAPDASCFISGNVGGKGDYGVTVISGDLQVSGNIYNTLGDGATTIFSPYLAQQILDPSSYALFTITNSSTTLYKVDWDTGDTSCTDPHVTFTAPPSGKVLVDVHAYIDDTSTSGGGPYVYLALSTSTAASIGNSDGSIVGSEKIVWRPDEEDDGVHTLTFYASGLTAGTSYTWNLFARRWSDGDNNRIICGAQYAATIMQVRPVMDNADIYSS